MTLLECAMAMTGPRWRIDRSRSRRGRACACVPAQRGLASGRQLLRPCCIGLATPAVLRGADTARCTDWARRLGMALAQLRSDEFLAVMAHELRNPLAPVRNAVEILHLAGLADPRLRRASDIIGRQVKHISRLIDDLMDASCLGHGKLILQEAECDLAAIVRDAAADYRAALEAAGQRLFVHGCDEPIRMVADATRIAQILANLLGNAAKFQVEPGVVVVQAEALENGSVSVMVCDTGLGIAGDLLDRMFDPFVQGQQDEARSRGGLGLGLTLARGLAELHGGTLTAESAGPGRGATFTLQLPRRESQRWITRPSTAPRGK
jgi:signal transduction histidine kinase